MLRARDNPFSADRVLRQRYRLDEAGWAKLLERLGELKFRAALVGPHGAGKTTLLEDLAARLENAGWRPVWVRLSAEFPRVPSWCDAAFFAKLGAKDVVLLDGAEQFGVLAWWIFKYRSRRSGGLVITTHRAGRLPTLRRCETTPELLVELVVALGEKVSVEESVRLHVAHHGNLREALRVLYDRRARGDAEERVSA
jgi:hypothetical protein